MIPNGVNSLTVSGTPHVVVACRAGPQLVVVFYETGYSQNRTEDGNGWNWWGSLRSTHPTSLLHIGPDWPVGGWPESRLEMAGVAC
jgi:hypothetical protein